MTTWLHALIHLNRLIVWLALAVLVGLLHLGTAYFGYGYLGFPLDDGWIHQTYARNLGLKGEFSFTPGVTSTGSTSPLWTVLLSLGYLFNVPFLWWVYGLGILFLGLSGFSMARLGHHLFEDKPWLGALVGLMLLFEWHLGWATVSGMETIFFIWGTIFLLERYSVLNTDDRYNTSALFALGLLGGGLTLIRPEGLGLAGLIGIGMGLTTLRDVRQTKYQTLLKRWLSYGLGLLIPIVPYLIFNDVVSGHIFPNTLYAKQQEYGLWIQEQFTEAQAWQFRLQVFSAPFIGAQILLIPGILKTIMIIWQKRNIALAIPFFWWVSHAILFFIRLPVTYQHGRYEMPVIPWILFLGIYGLAHLLKPRHRHLWPRVLSQVARPTIIIVTGLFFGLGLQAYAKDVRIIETEMVDVARWLKENTADDAIIAAHDIGAIGYFTERQLVDLAGLITPDVIPFIRDEEALLEFSINQQATYLVTFPSWYPHMTQNLPEIYNTNSPWARDAGSDNMAVFTLPPR
ncbi:MAG: hypothetical protein AAF629_33620 [Chloroflexota bacterium]